jgi:RNA polymerase sigma-70 factor (ECF subfamily)
MSKQRRTDNPSWATPDARLRCLQEAERFLPRAEAEDAVQEALLRAWRKPPRWVPPGGLVPWLVAITRNEALRLRARPHIARSAPLAISYDQPANDENLEQLPLRLDVQGAVASLSREERTLLEMRYAQDLTSPAMAERLGIAEGTVRQRLKRLRTRLRPSLQAEEAEQPDAIAG